MDATRQRRPGFATKSTPPRSENAEKGHAKRQWKAWAGWHGNASGQSPARENPGCRRGGVSGMRWHFTSMAMHVVCSSCAVGEERKSGGIL